MRARYYDPTLGRFLSEDSIGLAGCENGVPPRVRGGPTANGAKQPLFPSSIATPE